MPPTGAPAPTARLRDRKKAATRARILAAAEEMFRRKGYAGATTTGIAEVAGIAEGTIFNYFASKAEILVAVFQRAFLREPYVFDRSDGSEAADQISRFVDHYLSPAKTMDKALLREVLASGYRRTGESAYVFAAMQEMDRTIARGLADYLSRLQAQGVIAGDVDVGAFVEVGYAVVMYLLGRYAISEPLTYDDLMQQIREKLEFLTHTLRTAGRTLR
jgi:AcrR family transcriptional regulator